MAVDQTEGYWQWRLRMAERLAAKIGAVTDPARQLTLGSAAGQK